MTAIAGVLKETGWFTEPGVYVQFDGQFGSTGKGLLASVLAEAAGDKMGVITTNMGPNSGHTAYCDDTKIEVKQLPVSAIYNAMRTGKIPTVYLNAGAIVNVDQLLWEIDRYHMQGGISVHPVRRCDRPWRKA